MALRIWAPRAHQLDVLVGETRIHASQDRDGWWSGPELRAGDRYAIQVDSAPARPDPRSRWQPDGVNGPSCWIEQQPASRDGFHQVPLRDAVIYELHVGTFSREGSFTGAIPHLDHLVELGVTHVELMPVAQFSGTHGWGYDGVDLYAPHATYGGPQGLRELIGACHARGLAVLVDVVHNHFGPEGAFWAQLAPYTTSKHKTPWGDAINLDDTGSREVRRFLIDSAIAWLREYGADGLRLDALHSLVDASERHFVAELVDEVRNLEAELGRHLVLIGEYDNHDPRAVRERIRRGWGLDAHWNDDFHHVVHVLVTHERDGYYGDFTDKDTLAKVLEQAYALDGGYSAFRKTTHGTPFGDLPRDRLVAYIQSHDQVGNRAAGERLHHLAGIPRTAVAAALLFTSPFVPMLFQGEEWAASTPFCYFAQLESEALRKAVREGRRSEHAAAGWTTPPPDPTDPATRDASVLRWDERGEREHAEMLAWYRSLIATRRDQFSLRDPRPSSTRVERDGDLLVVHRGELALVCNLAEQPRRVRIDKVIAASTGLASTHELPPESCALVYVEPGVRLLGAVSQQASTSVRRATR
ncbi:MAG TPA: malto-oligosyltrehalose trehalohydrolase [Kofleriaceae bacterium]|nr:malto-oligosyltrehalose trehalohydrolase [Kofleriaceae bacterium]